MKNSRKLLSLLLVLAFVFSLVPMTSAASLSKESVNKQETTAAEQAVIDSTKTETGSSNATELTEVTFSSEAEREAFLAQRSAGMANVDLAGRITENAAEKNLSRINGSAQSAFTSKVQASLTEKAKTDLTEEEAYVRDIAKIISEPVGSQVETKSGTVNVIIWLTELPTALTPTYQTMGIVDPVYNAAKANAVTARASLKKDRNVVVGGEYTYTFAGLSATVSADYLETIANMPGVYCITESVLHELDYTLDPSYTTLGNAGARELFDLGSIHASGTVGTGVNVGVLDSGIQTNHPDLAAAYNGGWNYSAGYGNTTGGNANMSNPDGNHGTHVSGTIASQGVQSLGMAPGANLYMGQVFPNAYTSVVLAAVEDFSQGNSARGIEKCAVVNCSFGQTGNNTAYDAEAYAMNNAAIGGTMFVVSAGNYGRKATSSYAGDEYRSSYTVNAPSSAATFGISVAATELGGSPCVGYNIGNALGNVDIRCENYDQQYTTALTDTFFEGKDLFIALNGKPTSGVQVTTLAYLQSIPANSLAGKILVVGRGISFADYKTQAVRTGAAGLLIINRDLEWCGNMDISSSTTAATLPIFSAYVTAYEDLFFNYAQGTTVSLTSSEKLLNVPYPSQVVEFSSIGPVKETGAIKPDIIAPGYQIYSTDLDSGYTLMGGTSMSAPCITGLYALLKQAFPTETTAQLKARLMNTADPLLLNPSAAYPAADGNTRSQISVWEQGAGFVNIKAALAANVIITVANQVTSGNTNKETVAGTMSSFSFHQQPAGAVTDPLTATIDGVTLLNTVESIVNVPRNDTRYSLDATDVVTPIITIDQNTAITDNKLSFNVALDIDEDAPEGLYEGYIKVTMADDKVYYLPWGVRVGEAQTGGDFSAAIFTAERPIISTSTTNTVRASGTSVASNGTSVNLIWEGTWPTDSDGYSDFDLYLATADTLTITYYCGYVPLNGLVNDGNTLYTLNGFLRNQAYNLAGTQNVTPANGAYYLVGYFNDQFYYFDEVGVVYTNGTGTMAVELTIDGMYGTGTNARIPIDSSTPTVTGRIYSPALKLAYDSGFMWTEEDDFWDDGIMYYCDQSWNVIGVGSTSNIYVNASGTAYNLYLFNGNPYICDADGYFSLDMTGAANGGYPFNITSSSHIITGVEAFYWTYYYNGTSASGTRVWVMVGGNKTATVTPQYITAPAIASVSAVNGTITTSITNYNTNIPAVLANFTAEYSINGGEYLPLDMTGITVATSGTTRSVTLTFAQLGKATYAQEVTVKLTYRGKTLTAEPFVVEPVVIESVVADNATGKLTIQLDPIPVNTPTAEEFAITWDGGLNPADAAQAVTNFTYDPATGIVTYDFTPYATWTAEQNITFHVLFNGVTMDSNVINIPGVPPAEDIEIIFFNAGTVSVQKSEKVTLEIQTNPVIDWSQYTVTWTSLDKTIASVNSSGVVSGKNYGMTIITATITDPAGNTTALDFYVMVY